MAEGRQLEFDYLNARGERGRRRADPLRIISQDADWYLQAYCHTREDVRNFRVDRMSDLLLTDEPIGDHSHRIVPDTLFQGSDSDLDVVVDVSPAALPLLSDYLADSSSREVDGRLRVTLRLAHVHGLKRLVAGLPGPRHRGSPRPRRVRRWRTGRAPGWRATPSAERPNPMARAARPDDGSA